MAQQLTIDQIEQLNQISDPVARRRYAELFQLPQDMQDAFESENTTNSVWSITKEKHGLSDRNVSAVARIIGLIFLGELPIKNFIVSLKNDLKIDIIKAQAIAQDINQAIFQPVRESLMQVHNINSDTNPSTTLGAGTRMYANDANNQIQNPKHEARNPKQITNPNVPNNQTDMRPPAIRPAQPNSNNDNGYEAQRRREEVLNKIKQNQNFPPNQAKPMFFRTAPQKNIIDLRFASVQKKKKNKDKYNGFFTA